MSWPALLALIADELGADAAQRIKTRAEKELLGERFVISRKAQPTPKPDQIRAALAAHGWRVREAAAELQVHPSTIYRMIAPRRTKAPAADQGPTLAGRLVR
jgi:transcriptional regulator of acetoin/glycerol metabolism